jgi:transcriptional regulator with XRE-family HTH domain
MTVRNDNTGAQLSAPSHANEATFNASKGNRMQLNDEAIGVMESLDWLEPVAASSPILSGKHEQAALVRTVGERMRQARELCNLSQSEAARRIGYANPSKLSKVEAATDTNSVPLWLIRKAAEVYEVSVDFLFGITNDWETGVPRGTQGWLLDAWERARQRDLRTLDRVHAEVVTVAKTTDELLVAVNGVGEALTIYHERNEGFEETPASNVLVTRIAKLESAARNAEAGLKRFHLGKFGEAA